MHDQSRSKRATHLVSGTSESLNDDSSVGILASNGQEDLADLNTGDGTVRLSVSASHSGLKSICTSARQHLVDTNDVEGVDSDSHVESILSGCLDNVLVGTNSGGFESFG